MKKIVIIGPESTGKSTLCSQLAAHFDTIWCEEYARGYLLKKGTEYSYENLLEIAKGQVDLEERAEMQLRIKNEKLKPKTENRKPKIDGKKPDFVNNYQPSIINHQLFFIDTDMYVMKVWCEFVFNKCHQFILNEIAKRKYDLYLLCNIDLPWIKDELREYPDFKTRQELYNIYKDILINQKTSWVEISGNYNERFELAVIEVSRLLV